MGECTERQLGQSEIQVEEKPPAPSRRLCVCRRLGDGLVERKQDQCWCRSKPQFKHSLAIRTTARDSHGAAVSLKYKLGAISPSRMRLCVKGLSMAEQLYNILFTSPMLSLWWVEGEVRQQVLGATGDTRRSKWHSKHLLFTELLQHARPCACPFPCNASFNPHNTL